MTEQTTISGVYLLACEYVAPHKAEELIKVWREQLPEPFQRVKGQQFASKESYLYCAVGCAIDAFYGREDLGDDEGEFLPYICAGLFGYGRCSDEIDNIMANCYEKMAAIAGEVYPEEERKADEEAAKAKGL